MKYIISGTNRPGSRTLQIAKIVQQLFKDAGEQVEIINLEDIGLHELTGKEYGAENLFPKGIAAAIEKVNKSDGLFVITPEYNGSMPGALKYFIDHWKYPESFEYRPVAFVGLGGRFGGLRPVEHLQHVFGYRNGFIYPDRIFLTGIFTSLKEGKLNDEVAMGLLKTQVLGFQKFVTALNGAGLSANSRAK